MRPCIWPQTVAGLRLLPGSVWSSRPVALAGAARRLAGRAGTVAPPENVSKLRCAPAPGPATTATGQMPRPGRSRDAVGSSARPIIFTDRAAGLDEKAAPQQPGYRHLAIILRGTKSLEELGSVVESLRGQIGGPPLEMLWGQVFTLLPKRKRSWWLSHAEAELGGPLAPVCAHTVSALHRASPAVAAGVLHSLAHSRLTGPGPWAAVWMAAQASLAGGCAHLYPDDLARTAWALARAHESMRAQPALLDELATAGVAQHFELSGKDAATLAWAYVRLDHCAEGTAGARLLDVLVPVTVAQAAGVSPFFLASAAWAFTQSGRATPVLLDAIARGVARARPSHFSPHDVAQLAWSFAKAWQAASGPAAAAQGHTGIHGSEDSPEQAAEENFTALRHTHPTAPPPPPIFRALARVVERRARLFPPPTVARTAWAFATVGDPSPEVFTALSQAAVGQLRDFNPQELATVAWAYASVGRPSPLMFTELAARSVGGELGIDSFSMQGLAMLAHAFAKARHRSPPLFKAIAPRMAARMGEASPQAITMAVWAFATAGVSAPALFDAAAVEAASRIDAFQPLEIATTAWALTTAVPASGVSDDVAEFFVRLTWLLRQRLSEADLSPHELSLLARAVVRGLEHPGLTDAICAAPSATAAMASVGGAAGVGVVAGGVTLGKGAASGGAGSVTLLHCELGDSLASHALSRLDRLKPYQLCRTAHNLASLGHCRPLSYQALGRAASSQLDLMTVPDLATLVWAHAAARQAAPDLFAAVGAAAAKELGRAGGPELSQLALAFSAADVQHPSLFSPGFSERCAWLHAAGELAPDELVALHHWQLWRDEGQRTGLEPRLAALCQEEFAHREAARGDGARRAGDVAGAINEVAATLASLGFLPQRDVRTARGFRIGLLVARPTGGGSAAVAVELAPEHSFLCGAPSPTGGTALRWRQLRHFCGCEVLPLRLAEWARLSPEARPLYLDRRLADAFGHGTPSTQG